MFHYASSLYYCIRRAMNAALELTPPNGTFVSCALLNDVPLNDSIRYSTADFLRREIGEPDTRCLVKTMTLLKCTQGKQHELVAVSVTVPSNDMKWSDIDMTMFFERRLCNGKDVEEEKRKRGRGRSGTQTSVHLTAVAPPGALDSIGSSSELPRNTASDIVVIPWNGKCGWKKAVEVAFGYKGSEVGEVYSITFTEHPLPTLLDLAVILNQVSNTYQNYHLLKHQCYFYAALVCETMRVIFSGQKISTGPDITGPGQDQLVTRTSREGDSEIAVGTLNPKPPQSAGTFKNVTIVDMAAVLEKAENFRDKFSEARQAKLDGLEEHRLEEHRQIWQEVDKERQLRSAAENSLRAAERRAAEAEEYAMDLERRLGEALRQHAT
ncbi:hypothetical protein VNI00_016219 [Paramarasmius palmivorus]|uniref:Uncharacterized protein n=1 Tax=Paramarasmius palmivorus TaxID=297713 RepID=A0AAW0BEE3_9AGAR